MIHPGRAILCFLLCAGAALFCSCDRGRTDPKDRSPGLEGRSSSQTDLRPGPSFVMTVTAVREEKVLLESGAEPGDLLEFGWIHSVEHFPWTEFFSINDDGTLLLREMRVRGYGAGIPHQRSAQVRTEDGWIISSGIDEVFPSYNWINSHTAVGQVRLDGKLLFTGSDFPHHEALELRVQPRRKP
jgi:hypothetical protein